VVFLVSLEKVLKCRCPKWPRIGHLDICSPSYGQKKGLGVKLAIWLLTTKSRESTCSQRALGECDMALESFRKGLQVWFRPRLDRRSGREAMMSQSLGSPGKKCHSNASVAERHREHYWEDGGDTSWVRAMVSLVCQSARGLSQHPRVFPNVN
jgi:hypothetical protein